MELCSPAPDTLGWSTTRPAAAAVCCPYGAACLTARHPNMPCWTVKKLSELLCFSPPGTRFLTTLTHMPLKSPSVSTPHAPQPNAHAPQDTPTCPSTNPHAPHLNIHPHAPQQTHMPLSINATCPSTQRTCPSRSTCPSTNPHAPQYRACPQRT